MAKNLKTVLAAAGASFDDVVKWTIYMVSGQPAQAAMEGFLRVAGRQAKPPTISVLFVAGLAHPAFLIEMDAIAAVPEK